MPAVNRGYTPRTTRLLSEYLALHFPGALRIQEMHLTLPNPDAIARAGGNVSPKFGGVTAGYADAAVILPDEIQLWECKPAVEAGAVGQLLHYAQIFPTTVEASEFPNRRVTLHLLAARDKPTVRALAEAQGIDVVVYSPAWYDASVAASDRMSQQRVTEARAAAIVAEVLKGTISEIAAITEMEAIGIGQDSAQLRIENARKSAALAAAKPAGS